MTSPADFDHHLSGAGPRVLLLHSGMCTWVEWRRLIELLEPDYEVLAPTLPGSAGGPKLGLDSRSMLQRHADHVEELLDELGWDEPVVIVGSSFGGVCALELASRGRASKVVALAPPLLTPPGVRFYSMLFSPLLTLRFSRRLWPWSTRIGAINGLFFHTSTRAPDLDARDVSAILESMSRFPFVELARRTPNWFSTGPGMPKVDVRVAQLTTLVWGTADYYVPSWMRPRWQALLPAAKVVELPGFPHQPHLRDRRRIADLIQAETAALR